jgi:hypothetical protein
MRINQTKHLALSIGALLIFFALGLQAILVKTPTADEGMHMLRGQVLRQTDVLALQGQHAPLSHWLVGAFFFTDESIPTVTDLSLWGTSDYRGLSQEFLWSGDTDVTRVLLLARLPVLFVALLLGALISRWARLLAGLMGVVVALVLYAFSPNLLASSALATTDLVFTAAYVAAAFTVWFYWRRPSKARWLLAGLALGLAISSKLSGLIVLPVALLVSYAEVYWRNRRSVGVSGWWRPGLIWLSWLPVAGVVLWAAYRFELGYAVGLPFPLPAATFLSNFVEVQEHIERGHYSFLLGQRSNEGWWAYFGLAYVYKTPIVAFVLLIVAIVYVSWQRLWHKTTALWLPAGALFLSASASRLNIGFRHILPVVPFLWLLIGVSIPMWRRRRETYWALLVLLVIYALGTFRQSPHFLAYFNELVGGSDQGYRFLGDSNIDWGQDLRLLADYARDNPDTPLFTSYFGPSDPSYYGLESPILFDETGLPAGISPANPRVGRYALSVNHLQGATPVEPDIYAWFRDQEPYDNLGYSILVYDVQKQKEGQWIAHCLDPVPLVDEQRSELLVDGESLRHVYFDCRQSWVIPSGDGPGWYFVPLDVDPADIDPALGQQLEPVFVNRSAGYQVYHWPGSIEIVRLAAWDSGEFTRPDGTSVGLPIAVDGLAQHLYSGDSAETLTVGDGLGYSGYQWWQGDLIVQYHDFGLGDGRFLVTGLYDYATGERYPIEDSTTADSSVQFHPSSAR